MGKGALIEGVDNQEAVVGKEGYSWLYRVGDREVPLFDSKIGKGVGRGGGSWHSHRASNMPALSTHVNELDYWWRWGGKKCAVKIHVV